MSELSRLITLTTKLSNITTLVREKIKERLDTLNKELDNLPLDKDFAHGYKQAILNELKFLQDLVLTLSLEFDEKEVQ